MDTLVTIILVDALSYAPSGPTLDPYGGHRRKGISHRHSIGKGV